MPDTSPPSDDPVTAISEKVKAARAFAEEMQEQGIHVGLGSPPVCVTCGNDWPCADAIPNKLDPPCEADR